MLLPVLISQNLTRVETVSFSWAQIEFSALFGNHSPTFFFALWPSIYLNSISKRCLETSFVSVVIKHNYSLINWSFEGTSRKIQGRWQMVKILTN